MHNVLRTGICVTGGALRGLTVKPWTQAPNQTLSHSLESRSRRAGFPERRLHAHHLADQEEADLLHRQLRHLPEVGEGERSHPGQEVRQGAGRHQAPQGVHRLLRYLLQPGQAGACPEPSLSPGPLERGHGECPKIAPPPAGPTPTRSSLCVP